MIAPTGARAASPTLPLAYLVAAAAAFVVAAIALPWLAPALAGHYYHPHVLALTHTVTLGFITMTIIGASYQLIPVLMERPLASTRVAAWQLAIYTVGVIGVVGHFAIAEWRGFAWSAGLVVLAALTHVVHAGRSIAGGRPSFTRTMMLVALAGFALTAGFGTVLGLGKVWRILPTALFPALHAHVQLALLGWVLPTVLAVSARVYPMFLLAGEPAGMPPRLQMVGIVLGVPLTVGGTLAESTLVTVAGAVGVAGAVTAHLATVVTMVRAGKRPQLDWGLRFVLAGTAYLVPATLLGVALAADLARGPRAALAYGVLALGGWASLTIVGMMLKIVPFLVWYRVYGPRAGRGRVPTLAQISWRRGEALAFALLAPGMGLLTLAASLGDVTTLRMAGTGVALGALVFAVTLTRVLAHLVPARASDRDAALGIRVAS